MSTAYQPTQAELDALNSGTGFAPAAPGQDAAHEQEVLAMNSSQPLIPLPGGGVLGDLPPGVGTRALTFQPPTQPPAFDPNQPLPAPAPAPPSAPPPGAAPMARRAPGAAPPPNAEAQALANAGKAVEQTAQDKAAEGPLQQGIEQAKAGGLEERSALRLQQAADFEKQQKVAQQAHAQAVAEAQQAADEYKNFQFHDFYQNRSTASRITSIVGSFLGGLRSDGGPNPMLDKVKREADRDFEKQKLQLQSKENIAKLKREGIKDVDEWQSQQLSLLKIKQGMALDAIADHIDALTATATGKLRAAEGKTAADTIRRDGAQKQFEGQATLVESKLKAAQTAEAYAGAGLKKAEANKANAEAKAAGQKTTDDDEIFFDKNHEAAGLVSKGRGGAQAFATRDANFQDAIDKMAAYRNYIAKIGGRPKTLDQIKQARVLYKSAGLAVGAVSPNGTTKEAQEAEMATLGPDPSSITGWAQGPMISAVDQKIQQVRALKDDFRAQTLRPLHPRQEGIRSPTAPTELPAGVGGAPPGLPPGSIDTGRKTKDGRPVFKLANGQLVAPT